jgi:hypothetical protein
MSVKGSSGTPRDHPSCRYLAITRMHHVVFWATGNDILCQLTKFIPYRHASLKHIQTSRWVKNILINFIGFYWQYRVSQEECARLREGVPYVKVHRYNPKHLYPKLNGYGDNAQRKVWSSGGSTHCNCQLTALSMLRRWVWCHMMAD